MVKCSFEVPLQVFSYPNVSTRNILKTNNTHIDLHNSNKLIYTLSMHEMNPSIFGQQDPRKKKPGENQFGMKVYIMMISSSEYNN
jgi:hypothetical protein